MLAAKQQPVVGGNDDLGGSAHGAALSEVATDGAALVIGDGQVQVATVLRQGPGKCDDLERALPGAMFGPAGEAQPGLRQAADAGQHPARLEAFAGGEGQQLGFEATPGDSRRAIVRMPRGYRRHPCASRVRWSGVHAEADPAPADDVERLCRGPRGRRPAAVSHGTSTWLLPRLAEVAPHKDQVDADLLDFLKARA
jgi:hypothetical protein